MSDEIKDEPKPPTVHIWAHMDSVKHLIYNNLETAIKSQELVKWVQIPFDCLKCVILNKMKFDDCNGKRVKRQLCFEFQNCNDTWPIECEFNNNNINDVNLHIGQIIDCCDYAYVPNIWHQVVIDNIKYKFSMIDEIHVHYIGWPNRYDLWIKLASNLKQIAQRGTHTKQPHSLKNKILIQETTKAKTKAKTEKQYNYNYNYKYNYTSYDYGSMSQSMLNT